MQIQGRDAFPADGDLPLAISSPFQGSSLGRCSTFGTLFPSGSSSQEPQRFPSPIAFEGRRTRQGGAMSRVVRRRAGGKACLSRRCVKVGCGGLARFHGVGVGGCFSSPRPFFLGMAVRDGRMRPYTYWHGWLRRARREAGFVGLGEMRVGIPRYTSNRKRRRRGDRLAHAARSRSDEAKSECPSIAFSPGKRGSGYARFLLRT